MLRNHIVVAFRNLKKHKFYSLINILGLSVGLTCFLFIALFVSDEFSYDTFHSDGKSIYRMDFAGSINGNEIKSALMSAPAAQTMKADYPEVTDAFRFRSTGNWFIKRKDRETNFKEEHVIFADSNFFSFWDYSLISGDPKKCLARPNTLVINESTAKKIFGDDDPVGKTVVLDNSTDYEVTGVFPDFPQNTHFDYDVMLTMLDREESKSPIWMSFNFNTYLKLQDGFNASELEAKFPALIDSKVGPEIKRYMSMSMDEFASGGNYVGFSLFPVKDIHLYSDKIGDLGGNGDITYVYIFSAIGLFILLLAVINFMNLATARSANRAKEVGLRKVMGAFRSQLIRQFLSEAMMISLISTLLALGLSVLLLDPFNSLSGKEIAVSQIFSMKFLVVAGIIMVVVGILSGSYPSFYLSSFRPAETLKGKLTLGFKSGGIRSTLVVLQFTVSIVMIIGTAIVFDQLSFIQNKKLGFDKDQVLMIHDAWILDDQVEAFKNEGLRESSIKSATVSSFFPVGTSNNNNIYWPGVDMNGEETYIVSNYWIDTDYIPTLGMEIVEGRNFSADLSTDSTAAIVSEELVKQMGLIDPLGKTVSTYRGSQSAPEVSSFKIIGVVKNFHFKSMKESFSPVIFHLGRNSGFVAFKFKTQNVDQTISYLRSKWDELAPGQPFSYSFLDDRFDKIYSSERQVGQIFGVFAILAIFIACLGLFGLASFTAEQKRKEIGIRKVLGASVSHIVNKLSLNFIKLVVISFIIASPLAYYGMNKWLQDFAFRTDIKWWLFLLAGVTASLIAWLTMGYQSWRAARANPVVSLRNE